MNGPPTEDVIEGATKTIEYAVQDLTDQLRKLESAIEGLQVTIDRLMKENNQLKFRLCDAEDVIQLRNSKIYSLVKENESLKDQLSMVS